MNNTPATAYITEIKDILVAARANAYRAVHAEMVSAYWQIGQRIVQEEQNDQERTQYGKEIIKTLSAELTRKFGKGFGERSLRNMRQFYLYFQYIEIWKTPFPNLGWSHFQHVLKVLNEQARNPLMRTVFPPLHGHPRKSQCDLAWEPVAGEGRPFQMRAAYLGKRAGWGFLLS